MRIRKLNETMRIRLLSLASAAGRSLVIPFNDAPIFKSRPKSRNWSRWNSRSLDEDGLLRET